MFKINKYLTCYYNIIDRAKSRVLPKDTYIERHHIIPKSLGGSNSKDNLVKLTAKEHLICHRLLTKITEGTHRQKMVYALWRMMFSSKLHKRYFVTSRTYQKIRIELAAVTSQRVKNCKLSDEHKLKISLSKKGKPRIITPEWRKKIVESATGLKRAPYSDEHKQKIRDAQKGKSRGNQTDEHKRKVSESKKGKKIHIDPETGRRYYA